MWSNERVFCVIFNFFWKKKIRNFTYFDDFSGNLIKNLIVFLRFFLGFITFFPNFFTMFLWFSNFFSSRVERSWFRAYFPHFTWFEKKRVVFGFFFWLFLRFFEFWLNFDQKFNRFPVFIFDFYHFFSSFFAIILWFSNFFYPG